MVTKKEQEETYGIVILDKDRFGSLFIKDEKGKQIAYLQNSQDIKEAIKELGLTKAQKDDLEGGFEVKVINVMEYGKNTDGNFSRKHYREIAEILGNNCVDVNSKLAKDLIKFFEKDNERFDEAKFKKMIEEKCKLKTL